MRGQRRLVAPLALAVALLVPALGGAVPPATYELTWGSQGSGPGEFFWSSLIVGLAVESDGNVLVADTNNHRIQRFDANGNFLSSWGSAGGGPGQFSILFGVAVDSAGSVYALDGGSRQVQKFTAAGAWLTSWSLGGFGFLSAIEVGDDDVVHVVDGGSGKVSQFDTNGNLIDSWPTAGSGANGLAVDPAGRVYVGFTGSRRIEQYDASGNPIKQWGTPGTGAGQFGWVGDLGFAHGELFVADGGNARVQRFDADGTYLGEFPTQASVDGLFSLPLGLAAAGSGHLYVADLWRIERFRIAEPGPAERITRLNEEVVVLRHTGELRRGPATALTSILDAALRSIHADRPGAAGNQLLAFANKVAALVRSRRLDPEIGAGLVATAVSIFDQLNGP